MNKKGSLKTLVLNVKAAQKAQEGELTKEELGFLENVFKVYLKVGVLPEILNIDLECGIITLNPVRSSKDNIYNALIILLPRIHTSRSVSVGTKGVRDQLKLIPEDSKIHTIGIADISVIGAMVVNMQRIVKETKDVEDRRAGSTGIIRTGRKSNESMLHLLLPIFQTLSPKQFNIFAARSFIDSINYLEDALL